MASEASGHALETPPFSCLLPIFLRNSLGARDRLARQMMLNIAVILIFDGHSNTSLARHQELGHDEWHYVQFNPPEDGKRGCEGRITRAAGNAVTTRCSAMRQTGHFISRCGFHARCAFASRFGNPNRQA